MVRLTLCIVVVVLMNASTANSLPGGGQNDAGSGGDAPSSAEAAVVIVPGVNYRGELEVGDGADWYRFEADQGDRITVLAAGVHLCVNLRGPVSEGSVPNMDARCLWRTITVELISQAPASGSYLIQIEAWADGHIYQEYAFSLGLNAVEAIPQLPTDGPLGLGLPQNDADTGGDASDRVAFATQIEIGTPFKGTLDIPEGDGSDVYQFEGEAGDVVRFAMRSDGVVTCAKLHGPEFRMLSEACNVSDLKVTRLAVTLEDTGIHYLRLHSRLSGAWPYEPRDVAYSINASVEGIPPDPGHPRHDLPEVRQNDAGYGGDAPDRITDDPWPVAPGQAYSGSLSFPVDINDFFRFEAETGDNIEIKHAALGFVCIDILNEHGQILLWVCSSAWQVRTASFVAPYGGTYFLDAWNLTEDLYSFGLGVNDSAPEPNPPLQG